jgi:hypothetical protein
MKYPERRKKNPIKNAALMAKKNNRTSLFAGSSTGHAPPVGP